MSVLYERFAVTVCARASILELPTGVAAVVGEFDGQPGVNKVEERCAQQLRESANHPYQRCSSYLRPILVLLFHVQRPMYLTFWRQISGEAPFRRMSMYSMYVRRISVLFLFHQISRCCWNLRHFLA